MRNRHSGLKKSFTFCNTTTNLSVTSQAGRPSSRIYVMPLYKRKLLLIRASAIDWINRDESNIVIIGNWNVLLKKGNLLKGRDT